MMVLVLGGLVGAKNIDHFGHHCDDNDGFPGWSDVGYPSWRDIDQY